MKRRDFLTKAGVAGATTAAAATTLATPAIAQDRIEIAMVATWGRDFPGLGTGAQRFAARLGDVSDGRIQVTYYAAGERVGAFDSFDDTAMVLAEAVATLAVLAATLTLHWSTQPYACRHQNVAEMVLGSFSILAVLVGCIVYMNRTHEHAVSSSVLDVSLLGMLIGPVLVYGTWLAVGGQRNVANPSEMHQFLLSDDESGGTGSASRPLS